VSMDWSSSQLDRSVQPLVQITLVPWRVY
jgi:hypothetical protein